MGPQSLRLDILSDELQKIFHATTQREQSISSLPTIAYADNIQKAKEGLPRDLPEVGLGTQETMKLLHSLVVPALSAGQAGPRYFGFVTGGVTPASHLADNLVTLYDSNVQVHLPNETISTYIENLVHHQIMSLLDLPSDLFPGRTLTTGATASNILGLACARDFVIRKAKHDENYSVGESGFGGVQVKIFSAGAHASSLKAASVVGIGRGNCVEVVSEEEGDVCAFDLGKLEDRLAEGRKEGWGCIVVASFGEVNTGGFTPDIAKVRELCDRYGAWLHIDGAFGAFACLHPDFTYLSAELKLADSITLDGHKWLNVPYDSGIFLTRHLSILTSICGPGIGKSGPAYLTPSGSSQFAPGTQEETIQSPLNVSLENSRRFRALPLFASLLSLGKEGYRELFVRNIDFARQVEDWLRNDPAAKSSWEVLTPVHGDRFKLSNIVLFAPSHDLAGRKKVAELIKEINETRKMYASPTKWKGREAIRIAVSNWRTGLVGDDLGIVKEVLSGVARASGAV